VAFLGCGKCEPLQRTANQDLEEGMEITVNSLDCGCKEEKPVCNPKKCKPIDCTPLETEIVEGSENKKCCPTHRCGKFSFYIIALVKMLQMFPF
jgi:hypothetical protein